MLPQLCKARIHKVTIVEGNKKYMPTEEFTVIRKGVVEKEMKCSPLFSNPVIYGRGGCMYEILDYVPDKMEEVQEQAVSLFDRDDIVICIEGVGVRTIISAGILVEVLSVCNLYLDDWKDLGHKFRCPPDTALLIASKMNQSPPHTVMSKFVNRMNGTYESFCNTIIMVYALFTSFFRNYVGRGCIEISGDLAYLRTLIC